MKAERIIPPELVSAIAKEVVEQIKPLLVTRKTPAAGDAIMGVNELAVFLVVKKQRVYEMVSQRKVPHIKVGKFSRFRRSAIEKWLKEKSVPVV